ncbi:RNA-processing protein [Candidatus Woesearchaeota archaeon]|nr:RNA-processing protein [Candidatus Woesearchaeota archaeon]
MYLQEIKIPKERIAVLIGKKGEIKKQLEQKAGVRIRVNSAEGEVSLEGPDNLVLFHLKIIIKAIGRGFPPEKAMLLFDEKNSFVSFDLTDYAGKSVKNLKRIKSRLIGTEGRARKDLEFISGTHLSVYGKTVSVIGETERAELVRRALQSLILGAPHGPVFKRLQEQIKSSEEQELEE